MALWFADEPLPLILVGSGCTLRLRNVKVVNAASLAVCLQLAPGDGCAFRHVLCCNPSGLSGFLSGCVACLQYDPV
jgi:hypothetical protein